MQSPLSALNSDDVCAVMEPFCKQLTADKYRHKHVIDIKCTVINVGINWECHMLLNSCWAGVGVESNLLHWTLRVPIHYSGWVFHLCFRFGFVHLNSTWAAEMSVLISLFLCMSCWVFVLNSVFHHWSMFYQCFILTIEQLPNHFFLLTVDPWGLLGVKKKALICCLQFMPFGSSLLGPSSIYL